MSSSDPTYNGWSNYPTRAINLWLSNDQGLYELVREQASGSSKYELARWLEDDLCEVGGEYGLIPELEGFPADLLGWALGHVNWTEIAEAWLEDES